MYNPMLMPFIDYRGIPPFNLKDRLHLMLQVFKEVLLNNHPPLKHVMIEIGLTDDSNMQPHSKTNFSFEKEEPGSIANH